MCKGERSIQNRLWTGCLFANLVGLTYAVVTYLTVLKIRKAYCSEDGSKGDPFPVLASMSFCIFLVMVFAFMSSSLLAAKCVGGSQAGFAQGFLTCACGNVVLVLLLCSLMLRDYAEEIKTKLNEEEEKGWMSTLTVYGVSYRIGFLSAACYVTFFGTLWFSAGPMVLSNQTGNGRVRYQERNERQQYRGVNQRLMPSEQGLLIQGAVRV